jgi:hypothetical protein
MSRESSSSFLEEAIGLLVRHFGLERVQASLAKVSKVVSDSSKSQPHSSSIKADHQANPSVSSILERVRRTDEDKHRLLNDFHDHLKGRRILPESQDIRHFAQLIGLKEVVGRSRKDMVHQLIRFLAQLPLENLERDIKRASGISEQQRQQGFSRLTDKLMSDE